MILYHTSEHEIRTPDIHHGRKNADFGWGFYLTPDQEFAYRWARTDAVVNEYELDTGKLDIYSFQRNTDWFQYIFNNRRMNDSLASDVVVGPIANDTIFDTLGIMSSGYLTPDDALKLLMIGPEYTQVAIKTEKAIGELRWVRSEKIERMDGEKLKEEQAAYQEMFYRELETILNGNNGEYMGENQHTQKKEEESIYAADAAIPTQSSFPKQGKQIFRMQLFP